MARASSATLFHNIQQRLRVSVVTLVMNNHGNIIEGKKIRVDERLTIQAPAVCLEREGSEVMAGH